MMYLYTQINPWSKYLGSFYELAKEEFANGKLEALEIYESIRGHSHFVNN